MICFFRGLLTVAVVALATGQAACQVVSTWTAMHGQYADPSNWSTSNVPGDDCCVDEAAVFNLPFAHKIELDQTQVFSPSSLAVEAGINSLEAPTVFTATLDVQGPVSISPGAELMVDDRVTLRAASLTIDSSDSGASEVNLLPGSSTEFGRVEVGVNGGSKDSALNNNSSLTLGDLEIGGADSAGIVVVAAGTLTQTPAATFTLGVEGAPISLLNASSGSVLEIGPGGASVRGAGQIRNVNSDVRFLGDVLLDAGRLSYRESGGSSTRSFAAGSTITLGQGVVVTLDPAPLMLDQGQTLAFAEPGAAIEAQGPVVFGDESTLSLAFGADAIFVGPVSSGGAITLAGELRVTLADGYTPSPGDSLPLLTATQGFTGSLGRLIVPRAAGVSWRLEESNNTLFLNALEGLTGDFNSDGVVDTADYTVWRDSLSTGSPVGDYADWRENFGATLPASTLAPPAPEPSCLALLVVALLAMPKPRTLL